MVGARRGLDLAFVVVMFPHAFVKNVQASNCSSSHLLVQGLGLELAFAVAMLPHALAKTIRQVTVGVLIGWCKAWL